MRESWQAHSTSGPCDASPSCSHLVQWEKRGLFPQGRQPWPSAVALGLLGAATVAGYHHPSASELVQLHCFWESSLMSSPELTGSRPWGYFLACEGKGGRNLKLWDWSMAVTCLHVVICSHRTGEPFQLRSLALLQGLRLGKFYGRRYQSFPFSSEPCVGLQLEGAVIWRWLGWVDGRQEIWGRLSPVARLVWSWSLSAAGEALHETGAPCPGHTQHSAAGRGHCQAMTLMWVLAEGRAVQHGLYGWIRGARLEQAALPGFTPGLTCLARWVVGAGLWTQDLSGWLHKAVVLIYPHPLGTSHSGRVSLLPTPRCVWLILSLHWRDQFSCRCKPPSAGYWDLQSSSPEQLLLPDPVDLPASPSIAVAQVMAAESSYSLNCGTGSWFPWSRVEKLCWRDWALSPPSCGWAGWAAAENKDLLAWLLPRVCWDRTESPWLAALYIHCLGSHLLHKDPVSP